jgi:hypothetical protein
MLPYWGVFVLFGSLIMVMSIFVILLLPETKQVPIEVIWLLFDKHCGTGSGSSPRTPSTRVTTRGRRWPPPTPVLSESEA